MSASALDSPHKWHCAFGPKRRTATFFRCSAAIGSRMRNRRDIFTRHSLRTRIQTRAHPPNQVHPIRLCQRSVGFFCRWHLGLFFACAKVSPTQKNLHSLNIFERHSNTFQALRLAASRVSRFRAAVRSRDSQNPQKFVAAFCDETAILVATQRRFCQSRDGLRANANLSRGLSQRHAACPHFRNRVSNVNPLTLSLFGQRGELFCRLRRDVLDSGMSWSIVLLCYRLPLGLVCSLHGFALPFAASISVVCGRVSFCR